MSLRRTTTAIATAALIVAAATTAVAQAGGWGHGSPKNGHTSKSATVKTAKTGKGMILVSSSGSTLYMFTADAKNKDMCVKHTGCTSAWPVYPVSGKPTAGPGVKASLLGEIKVGKLEQVTYAGHPLYLYAGGSGASTSYIGVSGFGGTWYGVSPAGTPVK